MRFSALYKGVNLMARTETIELTNMCLLRNGEQVLVENRRKRNGRGSLFQVDMLSWVNHFTKQ